MYWFAHSAMDKVSMFLSSGHKFSKTPIILTTIKGVFAHSGAAKWLALHHSLPQCLWFHRRCQWNCNCRLFVKKKHNDYCQIIILGSYGRGRIWRSDSLFTVPLYASTCYWRYSQKPWIGGTMIQISTRCHFIHCDVSFRMSKSTN